MSETDGARQITMVPVQHINPTSTVNVRRTGVQENRDWLRESMKIHGFPPEHPVLLRHQPDSADGNYLYEAVSGQSRFLAAREEGLTPNTMRCRGH